MGADPERLKAIVAIIESGPLKYKNKPGEKPRCENCGEEFVDRRVPGTGGWNNWGCPSADLDQRNCRAAPPGEKIRAAVMHLCEHVPIERRSGTLGR